MRKILALLLLLLVIPFSTQASEEPSPNMIKTPNVAGQFYPDNPQELSEQLDTFLSSGPTSSPSEKPGIIFVPHAGYIYSGAVAGYGYFAAGQYSYKTIVLIGPSHYFDFPGASVWKEGSLQTPLGNIPVDESFAGALVQADPRFAFNREVYEQEHSLEVQLPFLQKTFKDFKIVPILMGRPDLKVCQALSQTLKKIIGERDDVLIVVSTDMSHYHDAAVAEAMDHKTLETIQSLNGEGLFALCLLRKLELCGFTSAVTGLLYARENRLRNVRVLKYAHSGDVTGDNSRVVGYSAIVFAEGNPSSPPLNSGEAVLNQEQKRKLLDIAKQTVREYVQTEKIPEVNEDDPRLSTREGAFVTLHKNGILRGCIGNIVGQGPLYLTVRDMAVAAASSDPRFKPVVPDELDSLEIEVSVLSVPQPIQSIDEIILGTHGVIVRRGNDQHGVFLPQVAIETGWSKEEFLAQLCSQKAGLPRDCFRDPAVRFDIFTAEVFSEKDLVK